MLQQQTLENTICATGIGLHTGQRVNLSLQAAAPNTGIVFRRVDLEVPVEIPATVDNVVDLKPSTTLGKAGVTISNIEHLLAAFRGMDIDNAFVDVNAEEVPAMDGSAGTFVFLIQSAGIKVQNEPRRYIRINKTIAIENGDKKVQLSPSEYLQVTCSATYQHPAEGFSSKKEYFTISPTVFQRDISRARSYSFARDEKILHNKAQTRNGNKDDAVVSDYHSVFSAGDLRYENEFLRHKILDAIGDLSLLGCGMMASYVGFHSDNMINFQLLTALLDDPSVWEFVSADDNIESRTLKTAALV